ncbi:hypothetical protein ABPG77_010416 [Micractinium sp. CCAP 211/92]
MEPERLVTAAAGSSSDSQAVQPYVTVSVPFRLLARLNAGRLVLAEHDDPGNSWHFGEEGELFQYKFAGRHAVYSGFTSLVLAHELQALREAPPPKPGRKQAAAGLEERSWLAFLRHVQGSSGEGLWPTPALPGILFAGKAIDCASVGVYTLGEGGSCRGLSLASEYETPGAD